MAVKKKTKKVEPESAGMTDNASKRGGGGVNLGFSGLISFAEIS